MRALQSDGELAHLANWHMAKRRSFAYLYYLLYVRVKHNKEKGRQKMLIRENMEEPKVDAWWSREKTSKSKRVQMGLSILLK